MLGGIRRHPVLNLEAARSVLFWDTRTSICITPPRAAHSHIACNLRKLLLYPRQQSPSCRTPDDLQPLLGIEHLQHGFFQCI